MCVVMDVEYSDGVVEWVWEDMVLTFVSNGVLPHRGVSAYGGGEVTCVLIDICACGEGGCENSLLEILKPIGFRVCSPDAL